MPYNFAADSFHTKNFVADFLQAKCDFFTEIDHFAFLRPPLEDLGATYDDNLRLIRKCVVDVLLVLIELFSLGVMVEALRANICSKLVISLQWGPVDPIFHVEGVAPTNHSSSQKTRQNDLSYGVKIWIDFSSVLPQSMRLTDGHTESFLIATPRLHSMQRGKNPTKY